MSTVGLFGAEPDLWAGSDLREPPVSEPAVPVERELPANIVPIFLGGPPWKSKATKIFAYFGLPENASASNPVPALVLVHGGGGSALAPWVRLWNERGYAAIAIDTCGQISGGGYANHVRHDWAGPPGWGGLGQLDLNAKDQWMYHAVAATLIGNSYLLSRPEIDGKRIGITGISWGGVIALVSATIDDRFKAVASVYGCGFLSTDSIFAEPIGKLGSTRSQQWTQLWDPSSFLDRINVPVLWVTGTNDFAFPLTAVMRSAGLVKSSQYFCITPRMEHAHGGPGEKPKEIRTFFDAVFFGTPQLPSIQAEIDADLNITCKIPPGFEFSEITLHVTVDDGPQAKRLWTGRRIVISPGETRVSEKLPPNVTGAFFNVKTSSSEISSSRVFFPNRTPTKR